jgi:Family of unknown function (DUF5681)
MAFKPGRSGNPSGKPRGTRNKTTLAIEVLLDGEAQAITRKAIEMAKAGDGTAMRLVMERLIAPRRDRAVPFALAKVQSPADALGAAISVLEAVAAGKLTPSEAADLSKIIDSFVRVAEAADLAQRIKRLEELAEREGPTARHVGFAPNINRTANTPPGRRRARKGHRKLYSITSSAAAAQRSLVIAFVLVGHDVLLPRMMHRNPTPRVAAGRSGQVNSLTILDA